MVVTEVMSDTDGFICIFNRGGVVDEHGGSLRKYVVQVAYVIY